MLWVYLSPVERELRERHQHPCAGASHGQTRIGPARPSGCYSGRRYRLGQGRQPPLLPPVLRYYRSARITVQAHRKEGTSAECNGQLTWAALNARFDAHTQKARRACHKELFALTHVAGGDPVDYSSKGCELKLRLETLGEKVSDEVYLDIMLSGLTSAPEFHFIREMHYRNEFTSVDCLQNTANRFFVDQQSRKAAGPAVSGRSDQCHRRKEFEHFHRDSPKSAQPSRPMKEKEPGKQRGSGRSGQSKRCSFHRTKTHSDAECKAQQENRDKKKQEELRGLAANLALLQAAGLANFSHLAQLFQAAAPQASQEPSEPTTFGFLFNALGASAAPAASPAASASASSASSARNHHSPSEYFGAFMASSAAESSLAPFRSDGLSILVLVDSGATDNTDNYLHPALTPGVRAHMPDVEDRRIPLPIIAAGKHVLHGVTTGVLFGTVADDSGHDRQVSFRVVLVTGPGTKLFSVAAALSNGVASFFYPDNPRLESGDVVVPMKIRGVDETGKITCSITVKLGAGDCGRQPSGKLLTNLPCGWRLLVSGTGAWGASTARAWMC